MTGYVKYSALIRIVHFNSAAVLSKKEKKLIASQLNEAEYIRSATIDKITAAKIELEMQGTKVMKKAVT